MSLVDNALLLQYYSGLPKVTGQYELEVRFGTSDGRKIKPGFDRNTFIRVREALSKIATSTHKVSRDYLFPADKGERIRYTIEFDQDGAITDSYLLKKSSLKPPKYFSDYGFYLTVSNETIDRTPVDYNNLPVREKDRWTFTIKGFEDFKIDMTQVATLGETNVKLEVCGVVMSSEKKSDVLYEIEVELLTTNFDPIKLNKLLASLLKEIQHTHIMYDYREKNKVLSEVNQLLTGLTTPLIDSRSLVQLRTLKHRDLRTGNLLPKPRHDITTVAQASTDGVCYSVTIKADGKRKLLYINDDGIYLVYYPTEVDKILGKSKGYAAMFENYFGTLIEGEYIPNEMDLSDSPKGVKLLMYDCLAITGDPTIRNFSHLDRVTKLHEIETHFSKIKGLQLTTKQFYLFRTAPEFFNAINNVLDASYWFHTDGCIFTPNLPYDTSKLYLPAAQRHLSLVPDIIKWKPLDLASIDFKLGRSVENGEIVVRLLSGEDDVFRGSSEHPYDPKSLDATSLEGLPDGTIVEMVWKDQHFELLRIRTDKQYPNSTPIALDVWDDINNPVLEITLRGKDETLLEQAHENFERETYQALQGNVLFFGLVNMEDIPTVNKVVVVDEVPETVAFSKKLKANGINSSVYQVNYKQTGPIAKTVIKSLNGQKPDAIVFKNMEPKYMQWYIDNLLGQPGKAVIMSDFQPQGLTLFYESPKGEEFFLTREDRSKSRQWYANIWSTPDFK